MNADRLAIVLSGGGAMGAFGVGVLSKLVERLPGLRWQIVSGTSTGSLITPFAALGANDCHAPAKLGRERSESRRRVARAHRPSVFLGRTGSRTWLLLE